MVTNVWMEYSASIFAIITGQRRMVSIYSSTLSPNNNLCTKPVR